jgi:hypothetical protein
MLVPLHPGGFPHSDTLGVPGWVQWTVLIVVLSIGAWLIRDARIARRHSAPRPVQTSAAEPAAAVQRTSTRPSLVKAHVVAETTARRPPRIAREATQASSRVVVNPVGVLILALAGIAGWLALDRAHSVDALATFLRTPGAENAARLAVAVASLFWAGGVVALVAPRLAAALFALAGIVIGVLSTAAHWERRMEWFGASAVLKGWSSLETWAIVAVGFVLLSLIAYLYPRFLNRG